MAGKWVSSGSLADVWVIPATTAPDWWLSGAAIDLDFENGRYYDGADGADVTTLLSCSRASIGYAQTAAGTLTQFAANELRITDKGLLVEDARTNIVFPSADFGSWTNEGSTETVDQATAPDGTVTMDQVFDGTATDRHVIYKGANLVSAGVVFTFSVYVKDVDRRYVELVPQSGDNHQIWAFFDLQTGTVTDSGVTNGDSNPNVSLVGSAIEALADGIYRLSITGSLNATAPYFAVALSDREDHTASLSFDSPVYTGTNKSVYMWGAQVEAGAFASSYIPTTTVAATRAADNITITGTAQTVIADADGSVIAQVDNGLLASAAANVVDSNGTNLLGFDATDHALASITATLATANTANRTLQDKLALAWDGSGRSLVLNGGTVATDVAAQTPNAIQHVGSSGAANFIFAYVERLTLWATKLADATLQSLTSP